MVGVRIGIVVTFANSFLNSRSIPEIPASFAMRQLCAPKSAVRNKQCPSQKLPLGQTVQWSAKGESGLSRRGTNDGIGPEYRLAGFRIARPQNGT